MKREIKAELDKARNQMFEAAMHNPIVNRAFTLGLEYDLSTGDTAILIVPYLLEHIKRIEKVMREQRIALPITMIKHPDGRIEIKEW